MTITIALDDSLAAALETRAKSHHQSLEQFAAGILSDAVEDCERTTPQEVVARIQAMPPNPSAIRPATGDLADALRSAPDDSHFNLDDWNQRWSDVEREMKGITRANDVAEGRGG